MPIAPDIWHLTILVTIAGVAALALHRLLRRRQLAQSGDLAWRPWHLRHAQLVYAETLFRCHEPIHLTAKVDRAYRADGQLHLVELKTRSRHRIYRYDVIELSAQRFAIQGDTGESVSPIAYVLTQVADTQEWRRHRVKLMDTETVAALARRRLAILNGQVQAQRTQSPALCRTCAYAEPCASRDDAKAPATRSG